MCGQNSSDCEKIGSSPDICGCSEQRAPRFLLPFVLLVLKGKESYGYELIEKISEFRFHDSPSDVGAIYRNLRNMEKEGWVKSKWDTKGGGPAKRVYRITPQGEEILHGWAITLRKRRDALDHFLKLYQNHYKKGLKPKRR
jgi:PadR family transcriptional regulator, regulatory protein PadR